MEEGGAVKVQDEFQSNDETLDMPMAEAGGDLCELTDGAARESRTAPAVKELILAISADLAATVIQLRQKFALVAVWYRRHVILPLARFLSELLFQLEQLQIDRDKPLKRAAPNSPVNSLGRTSTALIGRFAIAILVLAGVSVLVLSSVMIWALHDLPLDRAFNKTTNPGFILTTADGETLGRVGPIKLTKVDRRNFPEHLVQAVLSIEDRRFYSHFGIDLMGIVRAAHRNRIAGEIVQGGSTITQQLVRLRYLDRERSFTRKIREALVALRLERDLSKDEILTAYLNSIYVGSDAYGMPAASRIYFNKQISELTLAESAMLAGLIKAPSLLNPLRDLPAAQARAAVVLDAMVANGVIDQVAAERAKIRPAILNSPPELRPANTWFADWVAHQEAAQVLGTESGTMRVRTTLDLKLQTLAEKVVNDVLTKEGSHARVSQAALVALRPDGAVLAMVGGRDYRHSQFNRAVEANRHPGSLFKLFVYLAALRKGYSPHDVIDAGPIEIKNWKPENFGGSQFGRVTVAEAFTRSINTAAVRLAMDVGLTEVISAARDLGIDARLSPVPSLALGAAEVGLLDLTGAFASVRAGRLRVEPWGIAAFGYEHEPRMRTIGPLLAGSQQAMGHEQHAMMDMLRMVVQRGTARAASLHGFAAGKTGTSQNHRDAWFIGFNESLVVGVWVGNDDGAPMKRVVGGTVPAWIWKRFMTEAIPLVGQTGPGVATLPQQRATAALARLEKPAPPSQAPLSDAGSRAQGPEKASRLEQILRGLVDVRAPGQCNIEACARNYNSFNPADCTYQPYGRRGGRRLCETGMPSRNAHEQASEQSSAPKEIQVTASALSRPTEEGIQVKQGTSSDGRGPGQCNVEGCARKYNSFNPTDCTYQPYDRSARRLCEIGAQYREHPFWTSSSTGRQF